jgi:hypothetical protein
VLRQLLLSALQQNFAAVLQLCEIAMGPDALVDINCLVWFQCHEEHQKACQEAEMQLGSAGWMQLLVTAAEERHNAVTLLRLWGARARVHCLELQAARKQRMSLISLHTLPAALQLSSDMLEQLLQTIFIPFACHALMRSVVL